MIPERHLMVLLCALCTCLNYADRVNMSVAIISMSEQHSFNLEQQSAILSFFFLGYLPMQLGGAVLCRRYGGKSVLSVGAALWSLFTILTPFAASRGVFALIVCRVFMGLSEGVAFPAVFHFLSAWIPSSERARSVSLFLTGAHVGTMTALVVSPQIIRMFNWQTVFYFFGPLGFIWIAAWNALASDKDESKGEYKSIEMAEAPIETVSSETNSKYLSFNSFFNENERHLMKRILTDRRCLAVLISQTLFSMIHYVILSWLPTYFKHVYDVKTTSLSFTFLPYFAMAVFANVGGWIADKLLHRGMSCTRARKAVTIAADTSAALAIVLFAKAQSVPLAIGLISLSMAAMSINSGGFESSYLDMATPDTVGLFKAVCNTSASFAGFVAIPLSTMMLNALNGSWRGTFASLAICYMVKMIIFCRYGSGDRVLSDDRVRQPG